VGVVLTPIIDRQQISLEQLRHRVLAVDGHAELYQFLALIRLPDGTPLRDANERITSHLSGLFFRTTRLIAEYAIRPLFVFDGTPHALKAATLEERRTIRRRYEEQQAAALARGDFAEA
jgi:flap endonuclease-1